MASSLEDKLNLILNEKTTKIIPENIKKGVQIFNITGTLETSTSGGVKLFKTKEEMNSSTGNVEGDLALVYRNEQQNMTADMEVTAITFPETVTLPTAFTGNAYSELRPVDSSVMFNSSCMLDKNSFSFNTFSFDGWSESESTQASYTSEDGITYTRTSLQGDNPIKLPTAVKGDANDWNDNFGYFMQISGGAFEGIYIYKNNSWKLASTQLTATPDYVYKQLFYGKNGLESGTLQNKENLTKNMVKHRVNIWSNYNSGIVCPSDASYMLSGCENLTTIPLLDTSKVTNMGGMFVNCTNLTMIPLLDTSKVTNMYSMFNGCENLTTIPQLDTSNAANMSYMFKDCSKLTTIPELNTSNATNMAYMFGDCTNLTTIPELNTSKVTNMSNMFESCTNLTTIPELNTSKVTNMQYMFAGCTNLTAIPLLDTSNVTNMLNIFVWCSNLATIPLLNTSKVTNMVGMFYKCSNLSDDSLNNIMQMCINATSYTDTKTLKKLDLTSEQADKCKTLSNYSAFTSAGWTTGY